MSTKPDVGKTQALQASISRLLDIATPVVPILIPAFLVMGRAPRGEPILYAAILVALAGLTWASAQRRGDYGLWALYIGAFAIFSVARSFADETGGPPHAGDLIAVGKTVAFGTGPTGW